MDQNIVKVDVNMPMPNGLEKNKFGYILRGLFRKKNKIDLSILAVLHQEAIHGIRKFMVNGHLLSECGREWKTHALEVLANSCRNAFATAIGRNKEKIHCAIKLYKGDKSIPRGDWIVWTLARSELLTSRPFTLRNNFGPEEGQKAKENSAYASITGCSDGQTEWGAQVNQVYSCFYCDNLIKHTNYVNSRDKWKDYYKSAIVFPLRWIKGQNSKIEVKGFLSFDSDTENSFGSNLSCIYNTSFDEYQKTLQDSVAYQVGGMIADVLATTINLQDKIDNK